MERLARLLNDRNSIDKEIREIIGRPALTGHIGECIAAEIFNIALSASASASEKSLDGYFQSGVLAGKSVNIKYYTARGRILDLTPNSLPDYYLVMMGSSVPKESSRNITYPSDIASVHLFESSSLIHALKERKVKIGIATSVAKHIWDAEELYPDQSTNHLKLSQEQIQKISLFRYRHK